MFKKNKFSLFIVAMAVNAIIATSGFAKTEENAKISGKEEVAAIVNGQEISKSQVMDTVKNLSIKENDKKEAYNTILNQLINENLVNKEITASKIEQEDMFKNRLEAVKLQLAKNMYLERYLKAEITKKVVDEEYKKFKKANAGKKEAHARHILVKSEEEAVQIIKGLDKGASFEDLARQRSSDPTSKNGGDVGFFAEGEIIPEFSKAAFELKPGTYTKKPVKSAFGWHVIFLEAKRDRVVPELQAVENTIRAKLGQQAIDKLVKELRSKADIKQFDLDGKLVKSAK